MKSFKQIVAETVNPPKSPDERRFVKKHVAKYVDDTEETDDQRHGGTKKDRSRSADRNSPEDAIVYEELSDSEKEKKEKVVKSMKKNKKGFKDRYGDDWKSVMYATATKQAKNESVDLDDEDLSLLENLYSNLSDKNRIAMNESIANGDLEKILNIAKMY